VIGCGPHRFDELVFNDPLRLGALFQAGSVALKKFCRDSSDGICLAPLHCRPLPSLFCPWIDPFLDQA
jgi:hypothetical protein